MGKDIHVASMDVEAIAVIKKNSKKIIIRKDVSRQWRSYRSTSFCVILQKDRLYFKGTDRAVFLDKREFTGPIYTQIKEAVDFVLRNIRLGATIDGLVRKEKYELPPEAIREILFLVCIRLSVVEMGLKSNTWIL